MFQESQSQMFWEVSASSGASSANPASKEADVEIAPKGIKHILATTPNSHLEILTPKHAITHSN